MMPTTMPYRLRIGEYEGPIEKLWELIEDRKLEITALTLSQVTEDFLRHLETLGGAARGLAGREAEAYMRLLADFILIASRLVLLKSRSLLPDLSLSPAEESDIRDLERRLRFYRALRPAMKALYSRWKESSRSYGRPYFLRMLHAFLAPGDRSFFYPGRTVSADSLHASLSGIVSAMSAAVEAETLVQEKIVTLEEKIKEIIDLVGRLDRESFRTLARAKSRAEVIVTFLALLHLAREQLLVLEQDGDSSDIIIRTHTAHDPAGA